MRKRKNPTISNHHYQALPQRTALPDTQIPTTRNFKVFNFLTLYFTQFLSTHFILFLPNLNDPIQLLFLRVDQLNVVHLSFNYFIWA